MWAIFQFFIEKRDLDHKEEVRKFYEDIKKIEDRMNIDLRYLRQKQTETLESNQKLTLALELQKEKFTNMTEKFTEYVKEVRKVIEKHSDEIVAIKTNTAKGTVTRG